MSLPYENASAGDKALGEIQKVLQSFGCTKFGTMVDTEAKELLVQFEYRQRQVQVRANAKGYAAAWLRKNPWNTRRTCNKETWERKAIDQAQISIYSVLRDWIKGQITAVESGILSFEGAFLGQILLPNGNTVLEHVENNLKMLSKPRTEEVEIE